MVVAVALAIWIWHTAIYVCLLAVCAILFAIVLNGASCFIARHTPLSRQWALGTVSLILLLLLALTMWMAVPPLARQFQELQQSVPRSFEQLQERVSEHTWGKRALKAANQAQGLLPGQETLVQRIAGVFSSTIGAAGGLLLIVFLGFCLAIEPGMYTEGLLRLFPPRFRPRGREVLAEVGETLAHWILARLASMTIVAVLACIAFWLLGIPLAFILALFVGLLDFIPNIGPFLAAIPAVLLSFLISPMEAVYVAIALFVIQLLEAYIITPIIERKAVHLPPALTATVQIILGLSAGILGLALAAPLTATAMVVVNELYVKDYLEGRAGNEEGMPKFE